MFKEKVKQTFRLISSSFVHQCVSSVLKFSTKFTKSFFWPSKHSRESCAAPIFASYGSKIFPNWSQTVGNGCLGQIAVQKGQQTQNVQEKGKKKKKKKDLNSAKMTILPNIQICTYGESSKAHGNQAAHYRWLCGWRFSVLQPPDSGQDQTPYIHH